MNKSSPSAPKNKKKSEYKSLKMMKSTQNRMITMSHLIKAAHLTDMTKKKTLMMHLKNPWKDCTSTTSVTSIYRNCKSYQLNRLIELSKSPKELRVALLDTRS
jgi:hypothetical protein